MKNRRDFPAQIVVADESEKRWTISLMTISLESAVKNEWSNLKSKGTKISFGQARASVLPMRHDEHDQTIEITKLASVVHVIHGAVEIDLLEIELTFQDGEIQLIEDNLDQIDILIGPATLRHRTGIPAIERGDVNDDA